jgi:hypothetical protein
MHLDFFFINAPGSTLKIGTTTLRIYANTAPGPISQQHSCIVFLTSDRRNLSLEYAPMVRVCGGRLGPKIVTSKANLIL